MIYLDNAATTACLPEVVDAMLPFFRETYANASSIDHVAGTAARRAVEAAREEVAALLGARPEDVVFTSGSTESNNLAMSIPHRVVTSAIEHPSVLDTLKSRARKDDVVLSVDQNGKVSFDELRRALATGKPTLLSVIATNNEIGTEQSVEAIADLAAEYEALMHVDATQTLLTRQIMLRSKPALDGISISAHKIYGPKGVGALIIAPRLRRLLHVTSHGGGHERGLRSGTLNVPGIVGFGVAARVAKIERSRRRVTLEALRGGFLAVLSSELGVDVTTTVPLSLSSPHILSVRIRGVNSRALLGAVRDKVAFSLGSACATNKSELSHVLLAVGYDKRAITETFRVSFAADQLLQDVTSAAAIVASAAKGLLSFSLSA